jgi:hypothetical protein
MREIVAQKELFMERLYEAVEQSNFQRFPGRGLEP